MTPRHGATVRSHPGPDGLRVRRRGSGFTLIEMAVVLIIIGILVVSVLQGREMIATAEYKSFKHQIGDYADAFHVFRDRYNALPGDLDDATATADLNQNGGNGDGVINAGPTCDAASEESCRAWQHLRAASLLGGDPAAAGTAARPDHPYTGTISGFFTGIEGNNEFAHKMLIERLPADIARRFDREVDDGVCDTGLVAMVPRTGCDTGSWPDGSEVDIAFAL